VAVAHKLKPSDGLPLHPACAGITERLHHAARASRKQNGENPRTQDTHSRKRPKLKRNHKQHPSTIKLYRTGSSVQVAPEKVHADMAVQPERGREKEKLLHPIDEVRICSLIG